MKIESWAQFKQIKKDKKKLLKELEIFKQPILVAGCQRSGTTLLSTIFFESKGVNDYRIKGKDSELLGALILSGTEHFHWTAERVCFQTTYLNERYYEYFENKGKFKLVYILRNPYSVVYSMKYHWIPRWKIINFPLNRLFLDCGCSEMSEAEKIRFSIIGPYGVSTLRKACLSYYGKIKQLFELNAKLNKDIMIVEYDNLIIKKDIVLPAIYEFVGLEYERAYTKKISISSIKKANKLSVKENKEISKVCDNIYYKAKKLAIKY